jgi:hypothetical protein
LPVCAGAYDYRHMPDVRPTFAAVPQQVLLALNASLRRRERGCVQS